MEKWQPPREEGFGDKVRWDISIDQTLAMKWLNLCDILTPDSPTFWPEGDLLNVSHVVGGYIQFIEYWTSQSQLLHEVLITTPVNGMKRSQLSFGTYKSTTNKHHLAHHQQGLAAGGKLGWMPISARQDLTSFMLNSPVSWLWVRRFPCIVHKEVRHVT